jgi:hypothetical protein
MAAVAKTLAERREKTLLRIFSTSFSGEWALDSGAHSDGKPNRSRRANTSWLSE